MGHKAFIAKIDAVEAITGAEKIQAAKVDYRAKTI